MDVLVYPKVTFIPATRKPKRHVFDKQFAGLDEIVVVENSKYMTDVLEQPTTPTEG